MRRPSKHQWSDVSTSEQRGEACILQGGKVQQEEDIDLEYRVGWYQGAKGNN